MIKLASTTSLIVMISITMILSCPAWAGKPPDKTPGSQQLISPVRLTATPDGSLLVSDYQARIIATVNHKSLKVTRWFPVNGKPLGVAYARGHIYVGNTTAKCVEVYARGGKKLYQLNGVIKQPTDIAIDETRGLVFVVDGHQKNVRVFTLRGKFVRSFPGSNTGNSYNLVNPTCITVDPANQEVFVSDYGDRKISVYPRIQIFDYEGIWQDRVRGKKGMFGTLFSRPQGLAADDTGHIFMLDCYSGEIMVFSRSTLKRIKTMAGFGTDPGQLMLPLDMVMNPTTKDIYVTNNRAAAIEKFENGGVL